MINEKVKVFSSTVTHSVPIEYGKVAYNNFSVRMSLWWIIAVVLLKVFPHFSLFLTKQNLGFMALVKCLLLFCAVMTNLLDISTDITELSDGYKLSDYPIYFDLTETISFSNPDTVYLKKQHANQSWTVPRSALYKDHPVKPTSCQQLWSYTACLWPHLKTLWRRQGLVQTSQPNDYRTRL